MTQFVNSIRFLAGRAALPFECLADEFGALDQPDQVAAKIKQIVDNLPLPATLPPDEIAGFQRLDTVVEIRKLAKSWKNCLAECLWKVNDGTSAIYLAESLKTVCSVDRQGRMGWFLLQAKGPRSAAIGPNHLVEIHAAFTAAGIPPYSMIEAIIEIVMTYEWSHRDQPPNDDENFENIAVN